jgi:hypothetical protein
MHALVFLTVYIENIDIVQSAPKSSINTYIPMQQWPYWRESVVDFHTIMPPRLVQPLQRAILHIPVAWIGLGDC